MDRKFLRLVAAIALVSVACGGDELNLPSDGDPGTIEALAGNGQTGEVGGSLPESLVVRVTDAHGRPVPGQPVEFIPTLDLTGQLLPDTVLTDDAGRAAARWRLGTEAGPQSAVARVVGAPAPLAVAFSATADPAPPDSLAIVGGNNQAEQIGAVLPESLIVVLVDQFGNPITGADIAWSAQNGSLSSTLVTTGSDGRAAVEWTLGLFPGFQQATATYGSVKGSPVTFTAAATIGPAP
jgi:adhesin/invasin